MQTLKTSSAICSVFECVAVSFFKPFLSFLFAATSVHSQNLIVLSPEQVTKPDSSGIAHMPQTGPSCADFNGSNTSAFCFSSSPSSLSPSSPFFFFFFFLSSSSGKDAEFVPARQSMISKPPSFVPTTAFRPSGAKNAHVPYPDSIVRAHFPVSASQTFAPECETERRKLSSGDNAMTRTSARCPDGRAMDRFFASLTFASFLAETSAMSYTSIAFESRQMARDTDFDKCESIVSG